MNYFASHAPRRDSGRESSLSKLSIVIADGREFFAHQLRRTLDRLGAREVRTANDGLGAVALIRQFRPHVAIVDWQMPEMDGLEFARYMRVSHESPNPALPILMTISSADRRRLAAARDAGVNEVMIKPVTPEALLKRVTLVLRRPRTFITDATYVGPDRRRHEAPYPGGDRRVAI